MYNGSKGFYNNTLWFYPFIKNLSKDTLDFDPESFLYRKTIDLAQYLVNESKGDFFVSMPDVNGNADVLAHLRGTENLMMDMYDEEEWVMKSLNILQDIWVKTLEEVYHIVKDNNDGGCTIGWLNTWAKGRHAQMQCDLSVMISTDMFSKYIMPELTAKSKWMDHSLYHFDGFEQTRHLDMLLSIEDLDVIQWTCVAGQPSPVEFIPVLKKIQDAGKKLLIMIKPDELAPLMENLSSKGLFLILSAPSEQDADEILKKAQKLTHE